MKYNPLTIFTQSHHSFEGQRPEEEVHMFLYSHWILLALKIVFYTLLMLVPLVPILFFAREILLYQVTTMILLALTVYYMIIWSILFFETMLYLLDTWTVTNERIIDIDQKGFFVRRLSEIDLERVQDISVKTTGFLGTILDYGDIEIQSAGAVNKFLFRQVAHPQMMKDKIMKLVIEAKNNPSGKRGI